jgi:hypothetical protein
MGDFLPSREEGGLSFRGGWRKKGRRWWRSDFGWLESGRTRPTSPFSAVISIKRDAITAEVFEPICTKLLWWPVRY